MTRLHLSYILETEAKLYVQELIRQGKISLVWSFVLDYENNANPFEEVRNRIAEWKKLACAECFLTTDKKILNKQVTDIKIMNPIDFY